MRTSPSPAPAAEAAPSDAQAAGQPSPGQAADASIDAAKKALPDAEPGEQQARALPEDATALSPSAPAAWPPTPDPARSSAALWSRIRLRATPSLLFRLAAPLLFLALLGGAWAFATRGPVEMRLLPRTVLGSPAEVFGAFPALWFEKALLRNLLASLGRVLQGFGLAALVGVPLGILSGAFPKFGAFIAPVSIFGRNVPISALVPLSLVWFGIGEQQKVMFIFIACVMFIVFDASRAIASVEERYVQTALTLGASPHQVLFKVLVPLALPDIFGSLRLLFGLAFGYIILAEVVDLSSGVGAIIMKAQRRGQMEHVYLTLVAITLVAYGIDRLLLMAQRHLFPYREVER